MANSYLNRTPSSAGSRTTWTFSAWFKRSKSDSGGHQIFTCSPTSGTDESKIYIYNNALYWKQEISNTADGYLVTNRLFRDTNAWYHIVCQWNTTNVTESERMKIWINGVQETSFSTNNLPDQNRESYINSANAHYIGTNTNTDGSFFDGYMSHVAFVDGSIVAPTVFGETDSTSGIWKFKSPSGVTWGTNGFHLKFENSGNLGLDSAGSNNFTVNGNLKQALDTPSDSYATLNPLATDQTLTNGNTTAQHSGSGDNYQSGPTTFAVTSGKWYCECKFAVDSNYPAIGIATTDARETSELKSNYIGETTKSYGYYMDGNIYYNGNTVATGQATFATNDIAGMALDLESTQNTLKFYKNGSLVYTQNIADTPQGWYFACTNQGTRTSARNFFNFGNGFFGTTAIASAGSNGNGSLFEYDVPSGYYALNTKNLNTYG